MAAPQILWLPEFLQDNQAARAGLAVFMHPEVVKEGPRPEEYMAHWEDKVRYLLAKTEKEEGRQQVLILLDGVGNEVATLYQVKDREILVMGRKVKRQDEVIEAIKSAEETRGLTSLMVYLRNPKEPEKQDLLDKYPQDQLDHLNPLQMQVEQKELSLAEFLHSL
jgi:hypothetical protein